jgi:hypothetical protein
MSQCKHMDFTACVDVARLEDSGRFSADVKIQCAACGKPMRFIGLPLGLDLNGAAVSADGTEARLAIHPVGEPIPGFQDEQPAGFRILNHMPRE